MCKVVSEGSFYCVCWVLNCNKWIINSSFLYILVVTSRLFLWLVGCPWINLAVLDWILLVVGNLFTGSNVKTQSFNLDKDAKRGGTMYRHQGRWRREDITHSGLDYALNWRLILWPICLLATIRRSVTRPDCKWLFFPNSPQVCLCQSNYLAAPKQVGASDEFPHFLFAPFCCSSRHCGSSKKQLWDLVSAGSPPWDCYHNRLPCDPLGPSCSLHLKKSFFKTNLLKPSLCLCSRTCCQIGPDSISTWSVARPSSKQQLDGAEPHVSRLPAVCHKLAGSIWRHLGEQVIKAAFCQSAFALMWDPSGNEWILWAPFNPIIPKGGPAYSRCHGLWVQRHREPLGTEVRSQEK